MKPLNTQRIHSQFFPVLFSLIDCLSHLWFLLKQSDTWGWQSPCRQPSRWHPWETEKFEKRPTRTTYGGPQSPAAALLGTQVYLRARRDLTNRSPSGPRIPLQTSSPCTSIALDSVFALIITAPQNRGARVSLAFLKYKQSKCVIDSNFQSTKSCLS